MTEDQKKTKAQLIDELEDLRRRYAEREGAEDRYRTVSELTSDYAYCFRVEPDGKLVSEWVTGALDRVAGYSSEELQAAGGWEQLIHPEDLSIAKGQLESLLSNQATTVEYRLVTKDGRIRWMRDHARPVWDSEEQRVTRVEGAAKDITDLKEAEQARLDLQLRVQQAQKLESLETLAGGIAHDFNNLLMGVLGNAELALGILPPTSPARGDIESIREAGTRAAELANQMLAYSGKGHFVVRTVCLSEVVGNMSHLLEATLPKTTTLRYQLFEKMPRIEGDEAQMRQVVMSFVTNASEAYETNSGVVTISTGAMELTSADLEGIDTESHCSAGSCAYLEVADTGIGMDDETVANMFDPFFTTKFTGRGLGLAAVFGIVRGHKGVIKVESEPGKGTTVRALFPVSEEPARKVEKDDFKVARPSPGKTILVVDDEPAVLGIATRMLAMAGYHVMTARDGYEAVEVFKQHTNDIACVILDLTMPRMGGEKTFVEFQKINEHIPVLLSSGYTFKDVEKQISTGGFAGFLKKPYNTHELLEHISNVISE